MARPWPFASERLRLVVTEGDGPFRRAEHVERSNIVYVAWLRLAASVALLALAASLACGAFG